MLYFNSNKEQEVVAAEKKQIRIKLSIGPSTLKLKPQRK